MKEIKFVFVALGGVLIPLAAIADDVVFDSQRAERKLHAGEHSVILEFPFENQGINPVKVIKFEGDCDCMKGVPMEEIVHPQGKGVIRAQFEGGGFWRGKIAKGVWVHFDNGQRERLIGVVDLTPAVNVEPWTLQWLVGKPEEEKSVRIKFPQGAEAEVTSVTLPQTGFRYRIETVEASREYLIHITQPVVVSPSVARAKVTTTSKFGIAKSFSLFLLIQEERLAGPIKGK